MNDKPIEHLSANQDELTDEPLTGIVRAWRHAKEVASVTTYGETKFVEVNGEVWTSIEVKRRGKVQWVRDAISKGTKRWWDQRAASGRKETKRYRKARRSASRLVQGRASRPDCPKLMSDPDVRAYARLLRKVKPNTFSKRLNSAQISEVDRVFYSGRLPSKCVFLHEKGRFFSDWTTMRRDVRFEVFAGDLDVDMHHAHFSILDSLIRMHSPLADDWIAELRGRDIYDYMADHGFTKPQSKEFLNPLVYGMSLEELGARKARASIAKPNPPIFRLIGEGRRSLMHWESRVQVDAFGRPLGFWSPNLPENYQHNKDLMVQLVTSYELRCKAHIFRDIRGAQVLCDYHDGCILSIRDWRDYDKILEQLNQRSEECKPLFGMDLSLKCEVVWFEDRIRRNLESEANRMASNGQNPLPKAG